MGMKVKVVELSGESSREVDLPALFTTPYRPDLVSRAFWILFSHGLQPYGRDPMAGEKTTAETSNPPTGRGVSRVPRVKGDRHQRSGQAAGIASVVKGRLAHPPKAEKVVYRKINKKERKLALASAIAVTASKDAALWRGHRVGKLALPIVASDDIEGISKTSELRSFLVKAGLEEELNRLYNGVKRLSGKARMRGRAYSEKVGPLIVVSNDRGVGKAGSAIPGVEVVRADSLSVLPLAPGGLGGRLTIWTESSLELLEPMDEEEEAEEEVEMKVAA